MTAAIGPEPSAPAASPRSALLPVGARRWVAGARPRTLPAAVVPVLVGTAAARPATVLFGPAHHAANGIVGLWGSPWWRALGALVVALSLQVGTNFANDYSDGVRGADEYRVGPVRLVASGLATPRQVKCVAVGSFAVAAAVGLVLAWATSWWVLVVGGSCLLAGWFYTGGPRPYGYAGLGEVFVFVFFGLVATEGTYYVQTGRLPAGEVLAAATAVGLLATALLLANNVRDIETDRASGKRTLAVRMGRRGAGRLFVACLAVPFAGSAWWSIAASSGGGGLGRHQLAPWLWVVAVPWLVTPVRTMRSDATGGALLTVLAGTGRLQLVFGTTLAVSLWLWIG